MSSIFSCCYALAERAIFLHVFFSALCSYCRRVVFVIVVIVAGLLLLYCEKIQYTAFRTETLPPHQMYLYVYIYLFLYAMVALIKIYLFYIAIVCSVYDPHTIETNADTEIMYVCVLGLWTISCKLLSIDAY